MRWHETKFWRAAAIAAMVLVAALIFQLDTVAQITDENVISDTIIQAPAQGSARRGRSSVSRLDAMKAGGFIPWDTARGIFITLSDNSDRVVMWDLGSDWETSINFKVNNSTVFTAGTR